MKNRIAILIVLFFLVAVPNSVFAAKSTEIRATRVDAQENRPSVTPGIRQNEIKNKANAPSITPGTRQSEVKNQANENRPTITSQTCDVRLTNIKNRSTTLANFTAKVIETFDKIATRVKEYYEAKVKPSSPVANYDTLVADINAKKVLAQSELTKAQALITSFSCTTGDIKKLSQDFNSQMKLVKAALQNYRTSIKNLIVAVHSKSATITPKAKESTDSAKPTKAPKTNNSTRGGQQ